MFYISYPFRPPPLSLQAYLRLAELPFEVENVTMLETSPTGTVPALERGDELLSARPSSSRPTDPASAASGTRPSTAPHPLDDLAAAQDCIARLRAVSVDLDASIAPGDRSELAAFTALVGAALVPATYYAAFGDWGNFTGTTRPLLAAGLPILIGPIEATFQRRKLLASLHARGKLIESAAPQDIYKAAADAYAALDSRLRRGTGTGDYFFGKKPSSLDALLFGLLAVHRASPLLPPELRAQLAGCAALSRYLDRISELHFGTPALRSPAERSYQGTFHAAGARGTGAAAPTSVLQNANNKYWLGAAGAAVLAYLVLGGIISIDFSGDDEDLDAEAEAVEADSDQ